MGCATSGYCSECGVRQVCSAVSAVSGVCDKSVVQ